MLVDLPYPLTVFHYALMQRSSIYLTILTAVQTVAQSLNLTDWNGNSVPIVVRKTAAYRQIVDDAARPPVIYVSRWKRERVEPKIFGDVVWVWYPVQITTVAGGNQDLNLHIDYYLQWREQLRRAFQAPTLGVFNPLDANIPLVWDSNMFPETLLDEAAIRKNYDVELLRIEFRSQEQRLLT